MKRVVCRVDELCASTAGTELSLFPLLLFRRGMSPRLAHCFEPCRQRQPREVTRRSGAVEPQRSTRRAETSSPPLKVSTASSKTPIFG